MTVMNLGRDASGRTTYVRPVPTILYSATLTAVGGAQSLTVPTNALSAPWDVLFSSDPGTSVWVAVNNGSAIAPSSTIGTSNSELNPIAYRLKAGDVISFITTNTTANFGMTMYVVQQ
jgi:hypothetical protein